MCQRIGVFIDWVNVGDDLLSASNLVLTARGERKEICQNGRHFDPGGVDFTCLQAEMRPYKRFSNI